MEKLGGPPWQSPKEFALEFTLAKRRRNIESSNENIRIPAHKLDVQARIDQYARFLSSYIDGQEDGSWNNAKLKDVLRANDIPPKTAQLLLDNYRNALLVAERRPDLLNKWSAGN